MNPDFFRARLGDMVDHKDPLVHPLASDALGLNQNLPVSVLCPPTQGGGDRRFLSLIGRLLRALENGNNQAQSQPEMEFSLAIAGV